jgi:di/tricarboxylate transporter
MPLSFSSQLGGTLTLIGTSTNLLVSGVMVELGEPGFGFFQMTGAAAVLMLAGVAYLLTIGRRLLPVRGAPEDELHVPFREFESALVVEPDSSVAGSSFRAVQAQGFEGLQLKSIRRASRKGEVGQDEPLRPGDVLLVEGPSDALKRADRMAGLHFAMPRNDRQAVRRDELVVMEAVVAPRSRLNGRRVRELGPLDLYGGAILAVQRHGRHPEVPTAERPLRSGDLVLVEGTRDGLDRSQRAGLLLLVTRVRLPRMPGRWRLAAGILLAVILLAALNVFSMLVSVLLGVIAMTLAGCLKPADAYERVDWGVIILIGSIVPLGLAMQQTGAAQLLAALVIRATGDLGPYVVLGTLYLATSLLTEFISNNAAAVILTPVAVAIADALGVSPVPFAMAVMIAASNSFMTPIGYQTNTLIYGPGAYEFRDFARVGTLLSLLLLLLAVAVLPLFFPF